MGCETAGCPFSLAHEFLQPYFPRGRIEFREVEFDIATDTKATAYNRSCNKLLRDLLKQGRWERVVIGITNHTDNENGDPFAGYRDGQYIAGEVKEVRLFIVVTCRILTIS